ncbi:hypothetical protein CH64_1469 [Yersinia rohdei]|uniref:Uncharacterized protein n=1 Tax=Yersinia rohdei TaxID=29485 RepID=A0A0U1HYA4_YERRO|nr:hypothetical protein [Yersinia rohdei]AJJ10060.1 hypothetical protein CH64_1469 [Yersinia rohdei]MDN0096280.1 hypothetical protein [Yersinia rohdei]CNF26027.1 Uncharacterised protein [Yersinia rohdei]CNJ45126.1 Uncharacterised protein [Yersinia rohdei]CQI97967.1 Uncharacterised protein [Yersinia rohdei]
MTNKQTNLDLTEKQKEEIDIMALQRVRAMNSDEFFCNSIDQKVHSMEEHVRNYFQSRFTFHLNKEKSDK